MNTSRKLRVKLAKHRCSARKAASLRHRNVPRELPQQILLKILSFACQIPPLKFGQIFTLFFYPTGSGPKKRKCQATTDPDSETPSSSEGDSWSTIDTSTSEGEEEKDFILLDYPSEDLTSSESSDSEPEEASVENLSTGCSEKVTLVDPQFLRDHVGPQNIPDHIQSTTLSFLKLFLDTDFLGLLCRQTNLRAELVKQSKPALCYTKNFKPSL